MPGEKGAKGGKGGKGAPGKKPLVKSGPVYISQADTVYDMDLKRPIVTPKDLGLLAFCAWNFVVVGAVCGQYVADIFLYTWFMMTMVGINIGLVVALGSPLLWGQYVKRDMRQSMAKIPIAAGIFVGTWVVGWGTWILIFTFVNGTRIGLHSIPFPYMTTTWQVALYWTGLMLSLVMWAVVESVWWNLAFNALCGGNWGLRAWGALCYGFSTFCIVDPIFKGEWWWFWGMWIGVFAMVFNLSSHIVYDMASLGGTIGMRVGYWFAYALIWAHITWNWWGLDLNRHQWKWTPGNLFNLSIQGTVPPPI